jgi:hypothetical protein
MLALITEICRQIVWIFLSYLFVFLSDVWSDHKRLRTRSSVRLPDLIYSSTVILELSASWGCSPGTHDLLPSVSVSWKENGHPNAEEHGRIHPGLNFYSNESFGFLAAKLRLKSTLHLQRELTSTLAALRFLQPIARVCCTPLGRAFCSRCRRFVFLKLGNCRLYSFSLSPSSTYELAIFF